VGRLTIPSDYSIAHYGRINVEAGLDFLQQKVVPAVFPDGKQPAQVLIPGWSRAISKHFIVKIRFLGSNRIYFGVDGP
jgi:hypothetical protein